MDGRGIERALVRGPAACREQGPPPGVDEALHVPADPVRPLREYAAVVGEQSSTISPRAAEGRGRFGRVAARVVQVARIVLIRVRSSRQGFVGFLEIRQAPR